MDDNSGTTECGDAPTATTGYTIVHPGDPISFSLPEGTRTDGTPPLLRLSECSSSADVLHEILADEPIDFDLEPGDYLITFSADFESGRKSGGVSAGFGLVVDPRAEREVVSDPSEFKLEDHCLSR